MSYLSKIVYPINKDEFTKIRERYKNLRRTNEISFLRKTLKLNSIQKIDSSKTKELRRVLSAMEKADTELDVAESKLSEMECLFNDKERVPEKIIRMEDFIELQNKLIISEKEKQHFEEAYKKAISGKRKGGLNSYQPYKPLREKVKELCIKEMQKTKKPESASQLCLIISKKIESDYVDLLDNFEPYKNSQRDGGGWLRPTFYGWCNKIFKQG